LKLISFICRDEDFSTRGKEPSNEVQLHLWKDSSLREITELLKEVEVSLRQQGLKLNYYFVYPDKRGKNVMKAVGTLDTFRDNKDDLKTLEELHFQIGDFIALEVYEKKSNF
jgi:histone deacetylase complex subunit SAP18